MSRAGDPRKVTVCDSIVESIANGAKALVPRFPHRKFFSDVGADISGAGLCIRGYGICFATAKAEGASSGGKV